jgi:hypothetical protein
MGCPWERAAVSDVLLSRHPVGVLVRDIIAGRRQPTATDIEQIIERMATAPFDPSIVVVPRS